MNLNFTKPKFLLSIVLGTLSFFFTNTFSNFCSRIDFIGKIQGVSICYSSPLLINFLLGFATGLIFYIILSLFQKKINKINL